MARKQKELGESIPQERYLEELQKVKMYIADRNVYGIDLNPVAVELADVAVAQYDLQRRPLRGSAPARLRQLAHRCTQAGV